MDGNRCGLASNLSRHLRSHHVQVAHAFDFYANLTLIPVARFAHVPVIIGSHRQLGDLLSPAKFRAQAPAFRWCDAVTCNSQAAADRLAAAGVTRGSLSSLETPCHKQRSSKYLRATPSFRYTPRGHGRSHERA